ncbi:MAG: ABC transporter substrate-binding protein [Verrucomicrobia bacterium]|nr:ABC transporter substrate-binding protein [Verrucomicrobiota bacterium]MCH8510949.1 ABC transporter substrate-binding protein [Kiritimatiellia bacterium]
MNSKLRVGIGAAFAVIIVAAIWFVNQKPGTSDDLKVGVILPLTGQSAYIGTSIRNGMEIAINEFNEREDKPFDLRVDFSDTGGQPGRAVTAWRSMMASLNPQAFIAVQEGVKGLLPLAAADRRVLLATSVPDDGIAGVNPWGFRFFINAKTDAGMIARYAVEKLDKQRFAIIYVNDSMGTSYRDNFVSTVNDLGAEIVTAQSFGPADTDFRSQIMRVRQANPDAVYLVGYGKSLSSIPIQLRESGVEATLLSVGTISQPDIMDAAGDAVEGTYYTTSEFFTFAPETPELASFVEAYQAKFGQVPVFFEVFGYDSLRLILHAAEQGGLDSDDIRQALTEVKNLALAAGKVTVGEDGDVQFPVVVKMIKDGQWAPAKP